MGQMSSGHRRVTWHHAWMSAQRRRWWRRVTWHHAVQSLGRLQADFCYPPPHASPQTFTGSFVSRSKVGVCGRFSSTLGLSVPEGDLLNPALENNRWMWVNGQWQRITLSFSLSIPPWPLCWGEYVSVCVCFFFSTFSPLGFSTCMCQLVFKLIM